MSFLFVALVLLASSLHFPVISTLHDGNFEPFDCYKDLCMSRRQFCSDKEQRCKDCQPGHCLDISAAPKQCRPVCPELLKSLATQSTTTSTTTTTTSTGAGAVSAKTNGPPSGRSHSVVSIGPDVRENGIVLSPWMFLVGFTALFLIILVVAVLILLVVNLKYTCRLYNRFSPRFREQGEVGSGRMVEEGQALLREGGEGVGCVWGSKCSSKSGGAVSQATASSALPVKRGSTPQLGQDSKSVQTDPVNLEPPYTARTSSQLCLSQPRSCAVVQPATEDPATGEEGVLHHLKGNDYRLLPDGFSRTGQEEEEEEEEGGGERPGHSPPRPPRGSSYCSSARPFGVDLVRGTLSGAQVWNPHDGGGDETYPKSL
ncbi:hypothetical protein ACOMHN_024694 [Nucella lapillus]